MKTTSAMQQKVDELFTEHGFTAAGGIWGDAQWKKISPVLAVGIGQCYGPGKCGCPDADNDDRDAYCEALMRPEVFHRKCVVVLHRGDLDPEWEPAVGEAPPVATASWSPARRKAYAAKYGLREVADVEMDATVTVITASSVAHALEIADAAALTGGATNSKEAAEAALRSLVRRIGLGFHLDTRKGDYQPPLDADLARVYDLVVDAAFRFFDDPYAVAVAEMEDILKENDKGQGAPMLLTRTLRFSECEHTGDLRHYTEDLARAGAHIVSATVNEDTEEGTVVIEVADWGKFVEKFRATSSEAFWLRVERR